MHDKQVILELKNIQHYHDKQLILDQISFAVDLGEFVAIIGPSGSGKTTILQLIAGLQQVQTGTIFFQQQCIATATKQLAPQQRNFGFVFQDFGLWPHFTVTENIAFALRQRKSPALEITNIVDKLINVLQLEDHRNHYPGMLSGGQQQKVALARCLAISTRLILFDEPLASIDLDLRQEIQSLLLHDPLLQIVTKIYVTHNSDEALSLADRIIVLDAGRILQIGTPQQIYQQPTSTRVASLSGDLNILPSKILEKKSDKYLVNIFGQQYLLRGAANLHNLNNNYNTFLVCVRPEWLHITDESINSFRVVTISSSYLGNRILIKAVLKDALADQICLKFYISADCKIDGEYSLEINDGYLVPI